MKVSYTMSGTPHFSGSACCEPRHQAALAEQTFLFKCLSESITIRKYQESKASRNLKMNIMNVPGDQVLFG
jgi:hypothetical protein